VVLELDVANRRLALGHKQLEENPWDTFESVFNIGSVHKATVLEKSERGATLELPYGIEGFAFPKGLQKEDGSQVEAGESLDFKVTEFSKEDRKIILSHTATHSEVESARAARATKKAAPAGEKKEKAPKAQKEVENKSTLGDLDALSALKEQMLENEKEAGVKKLEAAAAKKAKDSNEDESSNEESNA
ncbi:MAG: S1 RNA-binding domain-containing protein, partial [Pontibacter sp.]|nr:S1 RNA-binding domain-containing protein [Pontibacter sp.]